MFCNKTNMITIKNLKIVALTVAFGLFASVATVKAQDAAEGEGIFKNNCTSCHAVTDEVVIGPGLKGISARRPIDWIVKWIHNPQAVITSGDKYAVDLYNKYNKTQMTAFPNLSEGQIKSVVAYIDAEAAKVPVAVAGAAPAAGGASSEGSSNGGMMQYILIGLLLVMILVLLALLSIVSSLSKLTTVDASSPQGQGIPLLQRISENGKKIATNSAFKTGAALLITLLIGKATIDAAYGIGIHQGYAPEQPIQFSHKLHAGQYQINCNYCHTGVYKGKGANIPSANICMNCHNAIKRESPEIQKIYTSLEKDEPIQWVRVHNLPDLAYFNHAQHTNVGGLECTNCHGEIAKMEVVEQRSSLTMGWCIDCHRKTNVNAKGNEYYTKLVELHNSENKEPLKVQNIGGLECSKCHY
jgi:mono/diheme cytochrome c family protein